MNSGSILVVEDNPDDLALMMRAFRRHITNDIHVVRDGAEALDFLFAEGAHANRSGETLPVVVLLDLMMPKIGGLEVLRRLRSDERTRLLPVVILTSSDEQKDVIDSYELGANGYVQKPVEFGDFSETVVQLGLYWTLRNKAPE